MNGDGIKIGLALSGGGFRASFFHIGVLAKLAECDVLRNVEAISCVSGGSIIGTHYYLELRNLLQTKSNDEITRQDYIDIMKKIEKEFLASVQQNIRLRIFFNLYANIKMLSPHYSRTNRMGELFEDIIYSNVEDGLHKDKRWINDLKVQPLGFNGNFAPAQHNCQLKAKVPILVINTTSLNTGNNFQFTATWMGEPPRADIEKDVDATYRLRRMYYEAKDTPHEYQRYRLGYAVAASACVPGLLEPITLDGLYQHRYKADKDIQVRLVDGGVSDNQGISALLEEDSQKNHLCNVLLVSDASGQMDGDDDPGKHAESTILRSNSVFQARLRIAQYKEISALKNSGRLKAMLLLHLKKDINAPSVDWIGCTTQSNVNDAPIYPGPLTSYGINKKYQECLSNIRTDLDSFSDNEAHALMASGYLMTGKMLPDEVKGISDCSYKCDEWEFFRMIPILGSERVNDTLLEELKEASKIDLK
ncbi:patatin-like phospholipase family protein [Candidatus Magnetobacterium casense]|uniref:Patatin-like phospholipase family protein n=1 Tax=Candidatus Magnetobacterium casense TaxID=1455061 RepID=A0ABS6S0Q2_9BACT|nr:patatin-like phospholipase family protein [Candidatus Magnetobacterium casensis]MBV6341973.1 patatin-like phospholipase family protein [Candidatus Magnetobacterium casensis]